MSADLRIGHAKDHGAEVATHARAEGTALGAGPPIRSDAASRPGPRRLPDVALVVGLAVIAVWRWSVMADLPGPVGVDAANWMRLARAAAGAIDIDDVLVPPIVPLIAGLLDTVLGPLTTARLLPVAASLAPALGLWSVVRERRRDAGAVLTSLAIALVLPTTAAFAWGGAPQLIGLGLMPVALVAIARAALGPGRRSWMRAGLLSALVGLTSTLVSVLVAAGGLLILASALMRRGPTVLAGLTHALPLVAPVAALYLVILQRMSLPEGRSTAALGIEALRRGLGEPLIAWLALLLLLVLALVHALTSRTPTSWDLLVVGLAGVSLAGTVLGDVRFVAGVPTAAAVAVLTPLRTPAGLTRRTLAIAGLAATATAGMLTQPTQLAFYAQFSPVTILEDVAHIAEEVPEGMTVAVPPVAGAPLGWWIEAAGIDAAVASRSDWLSFPAERARAAATVRLFSAPRWPDRDVAEEACALGAPWLYVPDAWGGMDEHALALEESTGRLRTVADLPGGVLLRSSAC